MSVSFYKKMNSGLIDRTLPEIFKIKSQVYRLGIIYFCWMLKSYGVDMFEISSQAVDGMGKLPSGLDFILRVESFEDVRLMEDQLIKKCVVNESFASEHLLSHLKSKGYFIILEVTAGCENEIEPSVERVSNVIKYADMLRISGIELVKSFDWSEEVKKIADSKKIKIDICPSDRLYMATSIALQTVMGGVGSVTLTFAGAGADKGFGAIEELLAAVQVLSGDSDDLRLSTLPEAVKHFKKISGMSIRPTKPVIGKNIFMYESGIHADGIEKNPETYEPFRPDMVGQKRQLAIGKHSGSRSVIYKLKEMGIECRKDDAEKLLQWIRQKSIREGRNLSGAEVVRLYKKHVKGA